MPEMDDMGEVEDTDEPDVDRIGVIVLQVVRGVDLSRWRRFLNQLLTCEHHKVADHNQKSKWEKL